MNTSQMYPNDRKPNVSLDQPNMRTTQLRLCTDVEGTVLYLIQFFEIFKLFDRIFILIEVNFSFEKTVSKPLIEEGGGNNFDN